MASGLFLTNQGNVVPWRTLLPENSEDSIGLYKSAFRVEAGGAGLAEGR